VGPQGKVSVRILRPQNGNGEKLPVIMYFHGGGWILGSANTHDRLVREIAVGVHAAVVFVNFTLSPEAQFPTPIEEAYAATKYIAEHGEKMNLDPSHLMVAGDSVGGNMAIAVTLLAKKRHGPKIEFQALLYPVTNADLTSPSYRQYAKGPWLTKAAMKWFWNAYLPDVSARKDPLASPLKASIEELKGLPPALVITDENDVLRDEGEAYAHKLMQAGVHVTSARMLGTFHDFMMLNGLAHTPAARAGVGMTIHYLREALKGEKRLQMTA
jgi:acetyl esterase